MESQTLNRSKGLTPSLIFLSAFGFALAGLNPTFFLDDSPETVTACLTLGIPHPPGYPLYTLLGYFCSALQAGHLPFRINLLSAVLASTVCVFLYGFLRNQLKISPSLSALFSLLWIAGNSAYAGALSAKTGIYHLTALFLLAILGALWERRWYLLVFLFGLSLTNHWMSMMAFLPGLGFLAYFYWKEGKGKRPQPAVLFSFFLLGLSLYLFLPLRAHLNPILNWGDPSTWQNFLFNFFRRQYGGPEGAGGPAAWIPQWAACGWALFVEFWGLLLLALWGWWRMKTSSPYLAQGLGLAWLGLPLVVGFYLNLPRDQYFLFPGYMLAGQVFTLLFAAWGTEWAFSQGGLNQRPHLKKAILGALLFLLLGMGFYRYERQRQTDYTYTYDFVLNGFQDLPRRALYFCKGDGIVFPGWYFQWIEGRRTDMVPLGLDGLPMEWIRKNTALFHKDLKMPFSQQPLGNESIPALARWIVDHNNDREIYLSFNKVEDGPITGLQALPYGLTTRAFAPGQETAFDGARADLCWQEMRLRHLNEPGFPLDSRTKNEIEKDYAIFRNSLGLFYEDKGDEFKARINSRSKAEEFFTMQQDYQKSFDHYSWAQQWDSVNPQYAYNIGNALFHLGRIQESLSWYEKAVQLKKDYLIAYFNWAVAAYQLGQYQKAGELFQKVLELKPDYAEARRGLDLLVQQGLYKK